MRSPISAERPYRVRYVGHCIPAAAPRNSVWPVGVVVENCGSEPWPIHPENGRETSLAVFQNGSFLTNAWIDRLRIPPGGRGVAFFTYRTPAEPGSYTLKIDMVRQGVAMFEDLGNAPLSVPVEVSPAGRARLRERLHSRIFIGRWRDLPFVVQGILWRTCRLAFMVLPRRGRTRSRVLRAWKDLNEALSLRELRTRRTRLRSLPSTLMVDTTVRCNLRCRLCVRQGQPQRLDLSHDLSPELLQRIVADLFPTARTINLSLIGEPLLTPHLGYLLDAMEEHEVRLNMLTNGTLLDRPIVRERIVPLLDSLVVSLDSLDPAISDRLRSGGDHERVLANLRSIAAIRRALPAPVFPFGLSVTLSSLNLGQLPALIALAAELGCTRVHGSFAVIFRQEDLEFSVFNHPERYNEMHRIAREQAQAHGIALSLPGPTGDPFNPATPSDPEEPSTPGNSSKPDPEPERGLCPFLYSFACIDHRGQLASCLHYDPPFTTPYTSGNIRGLWNSGPLRDLRRDHDTARAHRRCRDCHIILRGPMREENRRRQFMPCIPDSECSCS